MDFFMLPILVCSTHKHKWPSIVLSRAQNNGDTPLWTYDIKGSWGFQSQSPKTWPKGETSLVSEADFEIPQGEKVDGATLM